MYISDCTVFDSRNIACSRVMWWFELGCKGITYYLLAIRYNGGLLFLSYRTSYILKNCLSWHFFNVGTGNTGPRGTGDRSLIRFSHGIEILCFSFRHLWARYHLTVLTDDRCQGSEGQGAGSKVSGTGSDDHFYFMDFKSKYIRRVWISLLASTS